MLLRRRSQEWLSPNEAVVQLERSGVGDARVELVACVEVIERAKAEEVDVDVQPSVSKKDLGTHMQFKRWLKGVGVRRRIRSCLKMRGNICER